MDKADMKRMRIAIVDHVGLKAGMECYDMGLYGALMKEGCSAVIYSNFSIPEKGVIPVFKFRVSENYISLFRLITSYVSVTRKLRVNAVDYSILHCFRFGFLEWLLIRIIALSRSKLFLIVHDPESLIGKGAWKIWREGVFRLAEKIIVHNKFSYEEILKVVSVTVREKVAIIPHGNFIGVFPAESKIEKFRKENNLIAGKKYILFFGQIKETKGLDLLLDAFAGTSKIGELIIAGRMRKHSFDRYSQMIERNNLKGRVNLFINYITPETRDILFQLADAVVIPYRKVYQSGVMLMAMSYGKAVIASDLPPIREIVTDRQNGFLFKSENVIDLKRVLTDALDNDIQRTQISSAGYEFVKERLDWGVIVREWIKLLKA